MAVGRGPASAGAGNPRTAPELRALIDEIGSGYGDASAIDLLVEAQCAIVRGLLARLRDRIAGDSAANRIAVDGPSDEEMEKLRNSLCNDAVRGRQSTMYRAQRLAEFALYDSDPRLIDGELDHYLSITAADIKNAVARHVDVENRVVLDIVPAAAEDSDAVAASPHPPGDRHQPAAPSPQIPDIPSPEPESPLTVDVSQIKPAVPVEQPSDPADVPPQTKPGSGPLHP